MPIHTEQSASQDANLRTYWLQVQQAGHWRNLEQIADAADALLRTGEIAKGKGFDVVRLLEARFQPHQGQTSFFELVTFDTAGAHFAGAAATATPHHSRMDLLGTIAPLLPSAQDAQPQVLQTTFVADAALADLAREARHDRVDLVPARNTRAPERSAAPAGLSTTNRTGMRTGTRARLMTGVMAGAFVAGVAISALAPQQSGTIAAAIYDRLGVQPDLSGTGLAQASTGTTAEKPDVGWPENWGEARFVAAAPVTVVAGEAEGVATKTAIQAQSRPIFSSRTGADLEAENRLPSVNMLAAALAPPSVDRPMVSTVTQKAAPASSSRAAPLTAAQAYAMQASLPLPVEDHVPTVAAKAARAPVQVAQQAEQGLHLAPPDKGPPPVRSAAFTTAVAGDASQILGIEEPPRAPRKPANLLQRATRHAALADAIETGTVDDLLTLISGPVRNATVASLSDIPREAVLAGTGTELTPLLDFALLQGRPAHAEALANLGAKPSDSILVTLARSADAESLKRIAPVIRKVGLDPDRVAGSGMTALMQAAYTGDAHSVDSLLALGADPTFETGRGLRASDFAARAQHVAVQEKLVLAADQALYTPIMFGLSWSDSLETVKARSDVCKQVGEGFVACSLKAESWLDDTTAIIAQFDTRHGNRLVAIQVDSHLYDDPAEAEVGFKKAAQLIAKVLPPDQFGFPVRDIPPDSGMFHSLTPSVGAGQYFQYWPDDNLRRPVYVHMKMIGYKQDRGFHRIVIGNPFRVG